MKVYIGADHRGFLLKGVVVDWLKTNNYELEDVGALSHDAGDDYVDYGIKVVELMSEDDRGILICGSGHGMELVANRYGKARAILGFNRQVVRQGRMHEDANVLSIPADWVSETEVYCLLEEFLKTEFSGEDRHLRRLQKLDQIRECC